MIQLSVPGELRYRGVVLSCVAAMCRVVRGAEVTAVGEGADQLDLRDAFDAQLISACAETFNNIVLHAYGGAAPRRSVQVRLTPEPDGLAIELTDEGLSFDPDSVGPPDLDALPERGMGLFIVRNFVDEFRYTAGPPNVWWLRKRLPAGAGSGQD
jgi:serine/threonine-protein kinase RsbW